MTYSERHKLIEKMTLQLFHAKRKRAGVSMSHQLVELLVNELKLLQRIEKSKGEQHGMDVHAREASAEDDSCARSQAAA